jgi:hypothetical protein
MSSRLFLTIPQHDKDFLSSSVVKAFCLNFNQGCFKYKLFIKDVTHLISACLK